MATKRILLWSLALVVVTATTLSLSAAKTVSDVAAILQTGLIAIGLVGLYASWKQGLESKAAADRIYAFEVISRVLSPDLMRPFSHGLTKGPLFYARADGDEDQIASTYACLDMMEVFARSVLDGSIDEHLARTIAFHHIANVWFQASEAILKKRSPGAGNANLYGHLERLADRWRAQALNELLPQYPTTIPPKATL